jgi:tetratricopeptide (TPR) repeat protein
VAVLFFGGTLLPALGFFNLYPMRYSFVADHFQYHASLGLIVLIAAALTRLAKKPAVVAAVVLPVLAILTMRQATIYRDVETLWRDTLAKNPDSWMVHANLGDALARKGNADGAFRSYQRALELAPHLPETHWNVGVGLALRGEHVAALREFDEALRLSENGDSFPQARHSRGNVLLEQGKVDEAKAEFERAVAQKPGLAEAHFKLGFIAEQQGRTDDAIRHYTNAVTHRMDFDEAHYNLANVLLSARRFDEAMVHYSQSIRINPTRAEAHANLGAAFLQTGRLDDAIRAYQTALSINPGLTPAQRGLAAALQRRGSAR